eukprot:739642-Rhodomonas_salina.1
MMQVLSSSCIRARTTLCTTLFPREGSCLYLLPQYENGAYTRAHLVSRKQALTRTCFRAPRCSQLLRRSPTKPDVQVGIKGVQAMGDRSPAAAARPRGFTDGQGLDAEARMAPRFRTVGSEG